MVAVSRDSVAANAALRSSEGLDFPLYSVPDGVVIQAYGVLDAGADITTSSGASTTWRTIRSTLF